MNLRFQAFDEKVWPMNRSAKSLLILSTNLNSFRLANHKYLMIRQIHQTSPDKLSHYTVCAYIIFIPLQYFMHSMYTHVCT